MEEIDITIERRRYYSDEIDGIKCPECNEALTAKNQTVMLHVVSRNDEAQFMINSVGSTFYTHCPVVVFNKQKIVEAATIGIREAVEGYGVIGIIDLGAVPEEKRHMELGIDENPIPIVDFLSRKNQSFMVWCNVSKNAPCPCGSGKKHKRCCGKK